MADGITYCSKCGAQARASDSFCPKCGSPLRLAAEPQAARAAGAGAAPGAKKASPFLTLIIVVAIIAGVVWLFKDSNKVYKDFPSAGQHVKEQITKRDETLYVSLKTTDYNRFLPENTALKVLAEAVRYDGTAEGGERLALICRPEEVECYEVGKDGDAYKLNLQIHTTYYLTKKQEAELRSAADRILLELNLNGKSDYEKVRAIYNYICSHVTYDEARVNDESYTLKFTAYAAAINHTAVCSGIADLFYYLANSAGVETHIQTSSVHAWNFVKLDGKYYYLDATWDLGLNEWEYQYFLKGTYDFQHYGGLHIGISGNGTLLKDTDKGHNFSDYAY